MVATCGKTLRVALGAIAFVALGTHGCSLTSKVEDQAVSYTFLKPTAGQVIATSDDVDGTREGVQYDVEIATTGLEDGTKLVLTDSGSSGGVTGTISDGKVIFSAFSLSTGQPTLRIAQEEVDAAFICAGVKCREAVVVVGSGFCYVASPVPGSSLQVDAYSNSSDPYDPLESDVEVQCLEITSGTRVSLQAAGGKPVVQTLSGSSLVFAKTAFGGGRNRVAVAAGVDENGLSPTGMTVETHIDVVQSSCSVQLDPVGGSLLGKDDSDPDTDGLQIDLAVLSNCDASSKVTVYYAQDATATQTDYTTLYSDVPTAMSDATGLTRFTIPQLSFPESEAMLDIQVLVVVEAGATTNADTSTTTETTTEESSGLSQTKSNAASATTGYSVRSYFWVDSTAPAFVARTPSDKSCHEVAVIEAGFTGLRTTLSGEVAGAEDGDEVWLRTAVDLSVLGTCVQDSDCGLGFLCRDAQCRQVAMVEAGAYSFSSIEIPLGTMQSEYVVVDAAGNQSAAIVDTLYVLADAPVVKIVSPTADQWLGLNDDASVGDDTAYNIGLQLETSYVVPGTQASVTVAPKEGANNTGSGAISQTVDVSIGDGVVGSGQAITTDVLVAAYDGEFTLTVRVPRCEESLEEAEASISYGVDTVKPVLLTTSPLTALSPTGGKNCFGPVEDTDENTEGIQFNASGTLQDTSEPSVEVWMSVLASATATATSCTADSDCTDAGQVCRGDTGAQVCRYTTEASSGSFAFTSLALPAGEPVVEWVAVDRAGNQSEVTQVALHVIERQPSIAFEGLVSGASLGVNSGTVTDVSSDAGTEKALVYQMQVLASDLPPDPNAQIAIDTDTQDLSLSADAATVIDLSLKEGEHKVTAMVGDLCQNTVYTEVLEFSVDVTPGCLKASYFKQAEVSQTVLANGFVEDPTGAACDFAEDAAAPGATNEGVVKLQAIVGEGFGERRGTVLVHSGSSRTTTLVDGVTSTQCDGPKLDTQPDPVTIQGSTVLEASDSITIESIGLGSDTGEYCLQLTVSDANTRTLATVINYQTDTATVSFTADTITKATTGIDTECPDTTAGCSFDFSGNLGEGATGAGSVVLAIKGSESETPQTYTQELAEDVNEFSFDNISLDQGKTQEATLVYTDSVSNSSTSGVLSIAPSASSGPQITLTAPINGGTYWSKSTLTEAVANQQLIFDIGIAAADATTCHVTKQSAIASGPSGAVTTAGVFGNADVAGKTTASYTVPDDTGFPEGSWYVQVVCADASNAGGVSSQVLIHVDNTPPSKPAFPAANDASGLSWAASPAYLNSNYDDRVPGSGASCGLQHEVLFTLVDDTGEVAERLDLEIQKASGDSASEESFFAVNASEHKVEANAGNYEFTMNEVDFGSKEGDACDGVGADSAKALDGTFTFRARVTDAAGHSSEWATKTIIIDQLV